MTITTEERNAARLHKIIRHTDRAMIRGRLTRASRPGLTARLARRPS